MERTKLIELWKRQQQLLNVLWMWRLYGDVSQVGDDEALDAAEELVAELLSVYDDLKAVTRNEE